MMKKFMLIPILFFNSSHGMDYGKEVSLVKSFKSKCEDIKVNQASRVHVERIETTPEEVCAVIKNVSILGKGLPRVCYENPLKNLVQAESVENPEEYSNLVEQLAHMVLQRHRGGKDRSPKDHIRPLVFKAVQQQAFNFQSQCAKLEAENKVLIEKQHSFMDLGLSFLLGCLCMYAKANLFG